MSQTHALYRFYSATGQLLYVGITMDPGVRWKAHSKEKPWWTDVAQVTVEQHQTREAVLEAERAAIIAERPLHNIVHNGGRTVDPLESLYLPNRADQMPDDCHDHCAKAGLYSVYHPYRWSNGLARYRCNRGHSWTCAWGLVRGSGEDLANFGTPAQQFQTGSQVVGPRG